VVGGVAHSSRKLPMKVNYRSIFSFLSFEAKTRGGLLLAWAIYRYHRLPSRKWERLAILKLGYGSWV
jgi:hypothetical protein